MQKEYRGQIHPSVQKDPLSEDGFYGRRIWPGESLPRTRQLVDALNDCLGRGAQEMFHHSDDAGNPGSHMVTTSGHLLPSRAMEHRSEKSVRFDEVCVVADRKSFSLLVECIKGNGYHFTAHPDWNVPLRPSFQEALDFSNVRSDARRSLAKPAFPGGMGILPPVQTFRLPEYAGRRGEARNGYSTGRRV